MTSKQRFYVEAGIASPCWRTTHILLSCIAAIGSMGALIPLALAVQRFQGSCPLYAEATVVAQQGNDSYAFICPATPEKCWGKDNLCNYCLFTSVSSFIYSFIWLWFFSVCTSEKTKGMSSLSRPWLVIPPAIVFNFVMTILIFVASGYLTSGVNSFCEHLDNTLVKGCSRAQGVTWKELNISGFYTLLVVCQVFIWIASFAWLFGFLALLIRCCTGSDFKVIKGIPNYHEISQDTLSSSPGTSSI